MIVGVIKVTLYAEWVHSLKEKRMIVKSLLAKVKNTFNVSAIEAEEQDVHQTIVLGIAVLSGSSVQADKELERIIMFIEDNTEALVMNVEREWR